MHLFKNKIVLFTLVTLSLCYSLLPTFSQETTSTESTNSSSVIFPAIPNRFIPDIETLEEKPKNIIFKGSSFGFVIPQGSKTYEALDANSNSALSIKLTDSKNQELNLESELLTLNKSSEIVDSVEVSQERVIKIVTSSLPTTVNEGTASLSLSVNNTLIESVEVFISKTLSEKLELDSSLKTEVNSVSIINKPILGTSSRFLKVFVGGKNIFNKKLGSSLKNNLGLTKAILIPQNSFSEISSKVLKGKQVLTVRTTIPSKKTNGKALLFIITPFGTFTEQISIPVCTKACGEN